MNTKSDFLNNISSHSLEEISRHDYMLVTLSVAAIGYTINLTMGLPVNLQLVPSLVAVAFWGVSIIYSVLAMNSKFETFNTIIKSSFLKETTESIKALKTDSSEEGERKLITISSLEQSVKKQNAIFNKELKSYERKVKLSKFFFVFAIISFVVWWVLKLIENTNAS